MLARLSETKPNARSQRCLSVRQERGMSYGADKWKAADSFTGTLRSAQAMRFYALYKMLEAAEIGARLGTKTEAVEQLRELQAHCEKMIGVLAPQEKTRPKLVAA
jgi:hypothetical protein